MPEHWLYVYRYPSGNWSKGEWLDEEEVRNDIATFGHLCLIDAPLLKVLSDGGIYIHEQLIKEVGYPRPS
jgi:hypothetical protein